MSEPVLILELKITAGWVRVYGRSEEYGWDYWLEGYTGVIPTVAGYVELVVSQPWATAPSGDLDAALPENWPAYTPALIYPDFRSWFAEHYRPPAPRPGWREADRQDLERKWRSLTGGG